MFLKFTRLFGRPSLGALGVVFVGMAFAFVGSMMNSTITVVGGSCLTVIGIITLMLLRWRTQLFQQRTMASNLSRRIEKLGQELQIASTKDGAQPPTFPLMTGNDSTDIPVVEYGDFTVAQSEFRGIGVDYALARRSFHGKPILASFALSSGSIVFRDVLALSATGMQYRAEDLLMLVRAWRGGLVPTKNLAGIRNRYYPKGLLHLAAVLQHQQLLPTDSSDALSLFHLVLSLWGLSSFSRQQRFLALEAEMLQAAPRSLSRASRDFGLVSERQQLRLIRANVALRGLQLDSIITPDKAAAWLAPVNEIFSKNGYLPLSITADRFELRYLLDHLRTEVVEGYSTELTNDGPLVSIIMPTFQPKHEILTAARSVLEQTYRNLELIVVDDGSGSQADEILQQVVALDPRVRLIRHKENRGAYPCRNSALEIANGELITVHDDDDWSHPQKISAQVTHLIDNPDIPANMSSHVRLTESGQFVRINVNAILTQPNYSSLMFRSGITDKIGAWQEVRKGADSEFKERIDTAYELRVPVLSALPLSFTRTAAGNLTTGDISRGFVSADRRWFSNVHRARHRAFSRGEITPNELASIDPATPVTLTSANSGPLTCDVVYCTDFRFPGGTTALAVAELKLLLSKGFSVSIVQIDSPVNGSSAPIADRVLDFLNNYPNCNVVSLRDSVDCSLVIVRQPGLLDYADRQFSGIRAKVGILIANTTPIFPGGEAAAFDLHRCIAHFKRLFGVDPLVRPESPVTRKLLTKMGYGPLLSPEDWPGMAPTLTKKTARESEPKRRPVVGRHGRDHIDKWPIDLTTMTQVYLQPATYDTVILGGMATPRFSIPSDLLRSVQVYEFGFIPVEEFLASIDFFVHYPSANLKESFGMATVEALASGCVAVLPPYMSEVFGDAAVYAEPEDVKERITALWSDPEAYSTQSQRGLDFVEKYFSGEHVLAVARDACSAKF